MNAIIGYQAQKLGFSLLVGIRIDFELDSISHR